MTLKIVEHKSSSYGPRTYHNASQGFTLAVAVDFSTAGERLTHKAANGKIAQYHIETDWLETARGLYFELKRKNCHVVNIAGNGIYTFSKHGYTQAQINTYIYKVLKIVSEHWQIDKIVSGGQTGADTAALVAGVKLGIDSTGTWPKGFKMRFEDGKDVSVSEEWIREYILRQAEELSDV